MSFIEFRIIASMAKSTVTVPLFPEQELARMTNYFTPFSGTARYQLLVQIFIIVASNESAWCFIG